MSEAAVALPRRLSPGELRELLKPQLTRLRIPAPTLEDCAELVIYTWTGPIGLRINHKLRISDKPSKHLVALSNALSEVEQYWKAVQKEDYDNLYCGPLQRLRSALQECAPLVRKRPIDFEDKWEDAAISLATVFKWVVARSGSNTRSGLSKGGPSFCFVYEGLKRLGWVLRSVPTEDAVLQFLKRERKKKDIRL